MNLLKIIAHFLQILNKFFFEPFQNFVISIGKLDFYEKVNKITIKVLKKVCKDKEAFLQLLIILSHFPVKTDQSQSAFFSERRKYLKIF